MSQTPQGPLRGATPDAAPRVGVQVEPAVTNIPMGQPVSPGAQRAQQLLEVLRAGGSAMAGVGRAADRMRAERQRLTREEEQQLRGQAVVDARAAFPELQQRAERGQLDFLFDEIGPDERVEDAVREMVDRQVNDLPEPYAEQYRRTMLPQITQQVIHRQSQVIEDNRRESDRTQVEAAHVAETPQEMLDLVDGMRLWRADWSETQRLDTVIRPVMETAARVGDREKFEIAAQALGDRFPGVQQQLRAQLEASERRVESQEASDRFQARENEVAEALEADTPNHDALMERIEGFDDLQATERLVLSERVRRDLEQSQARHERRLREQFENEVAGMEIDNVPPDRMAQRIMQWRGHIPDTLLAPALHRTQLAIFDQADELEAQQVQQQIIEKAIEFTQRGDKTGGAPMLAGMIENTAFELPSGKLHRVDPDEVIEATRQQVWQQIDQAFPIDSSEQMEANFQDNLRARLEWLRMNPGVQDPRLQRQLQGSFRRLPPDTDASTVPDQLRTAFEVFRLADATHDRIVDAHLDAEDRDFFRTANFIHENLEVDMAGALAIAGNGMRRDPDAAELARATPAAGEVDRQVRSLTEGGLIFGRDASNPEYVRAQLSERARAYMIATGLGQDAAIKRAAEDFERDHENVNGWFVMTAGRPLIESIDLSGVGELVAEFYARDREDEPADNFTLVPDPGGGDFWRVGFADTGLPADDAPVLSDRDLQMIHQQMQGLEDYREAVERWNRSERIRQSRLDGTRSRWRSVQHHVRRFASPIIPAVEPPDISEFPITREQEEQIRTEARRKIEAGEALSEREVAVIHGGVPVLDPEQEPEPPVPLDLEAETAEHLRGILQYIADTPEREKKQRQRDTDRRPTRHHSLPQELMRPGAAF